MEVAQAVEEASILKTELPKRLEESVAEAIDKVSRDIQKVDANFPLDQLPFSKD